MSEQHGDWVLLTTEEHAQLKTERDKYLAALREIRVNVKHMELRAKGKDAETIVGMFRIVVGGALQATAEALGIKDARHE